MYNNVGGKLKTAAVTLRVILSIACVISGIVLISESGWDLWFIAVPLMLAGPMIIWLSSLVLYALGEAVDKLSQIERNTRCNNVGNTENKSKPAAVQETSPRHDDTVSPTAPSQQSKARLGAILGQSPDGVFIRQIDSGSTADISGLHINDKLLEINGTEITNADIARYTIVFRIKPGETVPFVIERDGVKMTVDVTF